MEVINNKNKAPVPNFRIEKLEVRIRSRSEVDYVG